MEANQTVPQAEPLVISPAEEHRRKANTAMILGIVGVSIFFLPVLNIAGFVLSIIALVKAKDNRRFASEQGLKENGMNTAGYICGIVGVILGALGLLMTIIAIIVACYFVVAAVEVAAPALEGAISSVAPYVEDALESAANATSYLV